MAIQLLLAASTTLSLPAVGPSNRFVVPRLCAHAAGLKRNSNQARFKKRSRFMMFTVICRFRF